MHYSDISVSTAKGLQVLQDRIGKSAIPSSKLDESLNVASWNIREFGKKPRLEPSIVYIAEIVNQFDLVALVELRDDLGDLARVMKRLGSQWDVVFSDFIDDPGGNYERIAYLYDTRMVRFTGLAAEADPPRVKNAKGNYVAEFGWWRAPYLASFEAGSFDFVVMTAHIRWGDGPKSRVQELREFREWITRRRNRKNQDDKDFIVMGDFNIPGREDETYKALVGDGKVLQVPDALLGVRGTDLKKEKTYDQILHSPTGLNEFSGAGGALDYYVGDWQALYPDPKERPPANRYTYELSDHLPLWLQIKTDIQGKYVQQLARGPVRARAKVPD